MPVERIELPTFGLQNRCSTAELNRLRAIDRIGVGSIAADRIGCRTTGLFMAAGWAASTGASPQNRFRAVVLPHDSAIIRVLRGLGRFRQTFEGRVGHGKRISAAAHARLSS